MIRFGLLGPLLLRPDGAYVDVKSPKHRTVLALLITKRNVPVRLNKLVGELWPGHAHRSAVENVRTYISGLRALLGSQRCRLSTCQGAYRLEVHDDELDTVLFDQQVSLARSVLDAGDLDAALHRYEAALALWRGEVLQDVPSGPSLMGYGVNLTEAVVKAQEEYYGAHHRAGDTDRAIAGLRQLLADHPTRESAWYQLISILYHGGDRVVALEAYQQARASLVGGLGLEPGPQLAALHVRILQGVPLSKPVRQRARQLPRRPAILVGRDPELARVTDALTRPCLTGKRGTSIAVGIHGLAGAGKSTLALAAAHDVADDYPDGQLYVNLQGCSPGAAPLEPVEVLGRFMRALGAREDHISPDVDQAATWFRNLTAPCRILVVLDNAASTAQIRPLLPAGPGCGVLVTSRHALDTVDGIEHLHLPVLAMPDAVDLLRELAGDGRVRDEPEAANDIVRLCGLLPLAVRVIGTRLARNLDIKLRHIADRLAQAQCRLDELGFGDLSVRSSFDAGYQALVADDADGQACRLFRYLGRLQLDQITTGDAAALLGTNEFAAWRALELLVGHGLIEAGSDGFVIHDLLRLYAAELAPRPESGDEVDAAVIRVAQRYISIIRCNRLLYVPMDGDTPHVEGGDDWSGPADSAGAAAWMARHLPTIHALVRQLCASPATVPVAWQLVHPLTFRLGMCHPADAIQLYTILVSCPHSRKYDLVRGWCTLSNAYLLLGRYGEALECARQAMALLPQVDDPALMARATCVYGMAQRGIGDSAAALENMLAAALVYAGLARWKPVCICLVNAATAALDLGRCDETLALLRRSLAICRRHADPNVLGAIMANLAGVHLQLGHSHTTILYATAAIRTLLGLPSVSLQFYALRHRSAAWLMLGRRQEAVADAKAAVALCERAAIPHLRLEAVRNLVTVLRDSGSPQADEALREADLLAHALTVRSRG